MEKEALEHAIRCWHAEEENAQRIAGRKTLLVGIPAGFLAFVGTNVEHVSKLLGVAFDSPKPGHKRIAVLGVACLAFGLVSFFVSVAMAVGVRRRDPEQSGPASRRLHPTTAKDIRALANADEAKARELAFTRTVAASRTLLELNRDVESRLYSASGWLVSGVVFSFFAFLAYAWVVR